jgi:hypothetical protein
LCHRRTTSEFFPHVLRSDSECKTVEGRAEPVAGGDVGSDVVVAAAKVLHEGVAGGEDPR